jgi:putative endonuclease
MAKRFHVYILASVSRVLYIGVTGNLPSRVWQHKHQMIGGFTARYRVNRLVYYEEAAHAQAAIAREKQLKGWKRCRKVALISEKNPRWLDLAEAEGFFEPLGG